MKKNQHMEIEEIRRRAFEAGVDVITDGVRYREDGFQLITRNYFTRLNVIHKLQIAFDAIEVEIMTTSDGALIYNVILSMY